MEATFAEASANDHVARLVATDFCGGDQMWKIEQVADSETGTAGRAEGSQFRQAARRLDSSTDTFCRRQSVIESDS